MRKYINLIKSLCIVLTSTVLFACGGGDSKPEIPPTPAVNVAPSVSVVDDFSIDEQLEVNLSASVSDSDGTVTSYTWRQTSGVSVQLVDADTLNASFIAPDVSQDEILIFELAVSDDDNASSSDQVTVTLLKVNQAPIAVLGEDMAAEVNQTVTISGDNSSDPDNDNLSYQWSLQVPTDSNASIANGDTAAPTITPDIPGEYILSLTVSDGDLSSEAASITLTVATIEAVSATVSGTVLTFNGNGVATPSEIEDLNVTVTLLNEQDEVVASDNPEASFNQLAANELRFNSALTGLGASRVSITVEREGYTSFSRRLDITDATLVEAKLMEVPMQTIDKSTMSSVSGIETEGFNIDMIDSAGAGGISINIPSSLLPNNINSIQAAVETFDPNDPNDAEMFPGEYADSSGQQLVSVAFNYAELMTDTGESVAEAMKRQRLNRQGVLSVNSSASLADEEPVIINRNVPASSCSLLNSLGDSDTETDGFQIPIYTFNPNTGLWDLLGHGTVFDASGNVMAAEKRDFDCAANNYVLEILVTNEIFLSKWWNLDYPLLFSQPETLCATIEVRNDEQQLLRNTYGFVSDKDEVFDFNSIFFVTDIDGRADIEVLRTSNNEDLSAEVYFYSPNAFGFDEAEITLSDNCETPAVQHVTLERPQLCQVSGVSLYEDGTPASGNLIYGFSTNIISLYSYDFTNADEDGRYFLNVACDAEIQIFDYTSVLTSQDDDNEGAVKTVIIDGVVGEDEISDNGTSVQVADFNVPFVEPVVVLSPIVAIEQFQLIAYGTRGSFPLTFDVKIENADGSVQYDPISTTLNRSSDGDDALFWFYEVATEQIDYAFPDTTGVYMTVTTTDAFGNEWVQDRVQLY